MRSTLVSYVGQHEEAFDHACYLGEEVAESSSVKYWNTSMRRDGDGAILAAFTRYFQVELIIIVIS